MMGLDDLLQRARGLNSDIKQKISLGRGMVRESVNAILFDEPLTVIDPHMKWELRTQLKSLHREFGHTMIYVTHDQTEALTFADKVVMLHQGQVVQIGSPEALFERPEHSFVGHFIGSPGMNFIDVRVAGQRLYRRCEIALAQDYGIPSGHTQLGIRPEYIRLTDGDGLPAEIKGIEDVGHRRIVRAGVAGFDLNVVLPGGGGGELPGARLHFPPEHICIYRDQWRIEGQSP